MIGTIVDFFIDAVIGILIAMFIFYGCNLTSADYMTGFIMGIVYLVAIVSFRKFAQKPTVGEELARTTEHIKKLDIDVLSPKQSEDFAKGLSVLAKEAENLLHTLHKKEEKQK